jgi:hypothetical protein
MVFVLQPVLKMRDEFKQLFLTIEISTVVSSILPPLQMFIIPPFGKTEAEGSKLRPTWVKYRKTWKQIACVSQMLPEGQF